MRCPRFCTERVFFQRKTPQSEPHSSRGTTLGLLEDLPLCHAVMPSAGSFSKWNILWAEDRCQPAQITAEHRILAPYRSPEKIFSQALEPNALCRIDDIGRDQGLCVGGL
jgi:hypothetical protein